MSKSKFDKLQKKTKGKSGKGKVGKKSKTKSGKKESEPTNKRDRRKDRKPFQKKIKRTIEVGDYPVESSDEDVAKSAPSKASSGAKKSKASPVVKKSKSKELKDAPVVKKSKSKAIPIVKKSKGKTNPAVKKAKAVRATSGSDSEPEDESFESSKTRALNMVQQIRESVKSQKETQKKERQKRQETNLHQKRQRLENLEAQKLSSDFLSTLSDTRTAPDARTDADAQPKDEPTEPGSGVKRSASDAEDSEEDVSKLLPDFIPVTEDGSERVVSLDTSKHFFSLPEQAASFRHQLLYGGDIRRQSAATHKAMKAKRAARAIQIMR